MTSDSVALAETVAFGYTGVDVSKSQELIRALA